MNGNDFVGTWKLVSAVSEDAETGQVNPIYKGARSGFIHFADDGRFIVIAVDSARRKPPGRHTNIFRSRRLAQVNTAYARVVIR